MQKTCFERHLDVSFRRSDKLLGRGMTVEQVMKAFFPDKVAEQVSELTIREDQKNAIILVGPSCCGKTTYARRFVKEHKDFVLVSMDKCAAEDMSGYSEFSLIAMAFGLQGKSPDDLGNRRFGRMLEAGHKNIIIDGNWMHVNSRGALLKTLQELNYHTSIYVIVPEEGPYLEKVGNRVCELISARRLGKDPATLLDGADMIGALAKKYGISAESAKVMIEMTEEYDDLFDHQCDMLNLELDDTSFNDQLGSGIIFLGADELALLNI